MSVLCSKAVIQQACNEGHWNMSPRMSFASIFPASFCWIRLRCPSLNWELRGFLMGSLSSSKQQTFSKLLLILASVCAVSSTTVAFCLLNPVASLSHWSFVVVSFHNFPFRTGKIWPTVWPPVFPVWRHHHTPVYTGSLAVFRLQLQNGEGEGMTQVLQPSKLKIFAI